MSGTGIATNVKFCTHIHRINRNKSPLKIWGKVAVGVLGDSRNFQDTHRLCSAHRAVIFAVARLSCKIVWNKSSHQIDQSLIFKKIVSLR